MQIRPEFVSMVEINNIFRIFTNILQNFTYIHFEFLMFLFFLILYFIYKSNSTTDNFTYLDTITSHKNINKHKLRPYTLNLQSKCVSTLLWRNPSRGMSSRLRIGPCSVSFITRIITNNFIPVQKERNRILLNSIPNSRKLCENKVSLRIQRVPIPRQDMPRWLGEIGGSQLLHSEQKLRIRHTHIWNIRRSKASRRAMERLRPGGNL